MEPENGSLEKEKHLETTSLGVPAINFRGCRVEFPYKMDPLPVITGVITPISRVITTVPHL